MKDKHETMKIAIAQINPTVGDFVGNYNKISKNLDQGKKEGANLVVFPELAICGYPPKDLLLKKSFIHSNRRILDKIIDYSSGIATIVGFVDEKEGKLYNAAALINDGKLIGTYHKKHLPNYDIFDEKRYFSPGETTPVFNVVGKNIGLTVCEDIWLDNSVTAKLKENGAELIINLSASPFHAGKYKIREELIAKRARENKIPIIYANVVGGQDDLVFDGRSYFFNENGEKIAQANSFAEDFLLFDLLEKEINKALPIEETEEIYKALVMGLRDYLHKNDFEKVVLGLSGGVDSALTAALAVEALGSENVLGVSMPSSFSSLGSKKDAQKLADNLGINYEVIPIKECFKVYSKTLATKFAGTPFNVAEENIQARIRGNILMALSNKFGYLVLTTGNKSELSVGYATLYGDMSGGLAVISDVLKTKVYELAYYINQKAGREIIPKSTLTKEPSAELREGQKDSDSLPPYELLDPILQAYVEKDLDREEMMAQGFKKEVIDKIILMVDRNEYKRQQAALGIKITPRAFGSGRRMPITNRWKEK